MMVNRIFSKNAVIYTFIDLPVILHCIDQIILRDLIYLSIVDAKSGLCMRQSHNTGDLTKQAARFGNI